MGVSMTPHAGRCTGGAADGGAGAGGAGGLHTLFAMVLGGLVGASPHMVSASVDTSPKLGYPMHDIGAWPLRRRGRGWRAARRGRPAHAVRHGAGRPGGRVAAHGQRVSRQ